MAAGEGWLCPSFRCSCCGAPPFLSLLGDQFLPVWHRDDLPPPGPITTSGGSLFAVMDDHLFALNTANGNLFWTLPAGYRLTRSPAAIPVPKSAGVVVTRGRAYAQVRKTLAAVDMHTGELVWTDPRALEPLAADREHLYCRGADGTLVAFRLEDHKPETLGTMVGVENLAIGHGLLFAAGRRGVTAFAPAERTFSLAADAPQREAYRTEDSASEAGDADGPPGDPCGAEHAAPAARQPLKDLLIDGDTHGWASEPCKSPGPFMGVRMGRQVPGALQGGGLPDRGTTIRHLFGNALQGLPVSLRDPAAPEAQKPAALADATILRLRLAERDDDLLRQVAARREAAPGVPMLLSLEWLDAARGTAGVPTPSDLARRVGALVAAARPEFVDLAPEINVYLQRYPDRAAWILEMVRAAAGAARAAAPETKRVVSLNAEVLAGLYGKGPDRPFGQLDMRRHRDLKVVARLHEMADAVGLTLRPQSAFGPAQAPSHYLLPLRDLLRGRPLLVTRIALRQAGETQKERDATVAMLNRLAQLCYWLDARLIACPEVRRWEAGAATQEAGDPLEATVWRTIVHWRRVGTLSSVAGG